MFLFCSDNLVCSMMRKQSFNINSLDIKFSGKLVCYTLLYTCIQDCLRCISKNDDILGCLRHGSQALTGPSGSVFS